MTGRREGPTDGTNNRWLSLAAFSFHILKAGANFQTDAIAASGDCQSNGRAGEVIGEYSSPASDIS